ncbi:DUF6265 family protein [bacterium]|nr:DUF6265 family protein [bacterium]
MNREGIAGGVERDGAARRLATAVALAVVTVAVLASSGSAKEPLDELAWLEGEWVRQTKRGEAVESWDRVSDDTMEGSATLATGEGTIVTEVLRLERFGEDVFYVAKPHQNPMPTPFRLVASDGTRFVFENPDHDFPQRIIYMRDGHQRLRVRIEGLEEGAHGVDFAFERKEESSPVYEW